MMLCRKLNQALGTTTITPWTLGDVPDIWIDIVRVMAQAEADVGAHGSR